VISGSHSDDDEYEFMPSGILHHVDWLIITDFPEELTTFLLRIKKSDKLLQAFTVMLTIFTSSLLQMN
jgi:hypothetical protein